MNVSIVLEQLNDRSFRATSFAPVPLVAEASTRQQAVDRIREMIRDRLSQVEVIQVDVPGKARQRIPWRAMIGIWKDHPDAAEIVEEHAGISRSKSMRIRGGYEPLRPGYGSPYAASLRPRRGRRTPGFNAARTSVRLRSLVLRSNCAPGARNSAKPVIRLSALPTVVCLRLSKRPSQFVFSLSRRPQSNSSWSCGRCRGGWGSSIWRLPPLFLMLTA